MDEQTGGLTDNQTHTNIYKLTGKHSQIDGQGVRQKGKQADRQTGRQTINVI
jgi:hypothetical protein